MKSEDILPVAAGVVLILLVVGLVGYTLYSALSYWEFKSMIKDCDRDFGKNNWLFISNDDYWGCSNSNQQSITNSYSKCYINDIEVACKK